MASSIDSHRQCAICLEDMTLRTPRALSCLHSFCSVCLEHLPVKRAMVLECPVCRKETKLQKKGIKSLPENFYLKNDELTTNKIRCDECAVSRQESVPADLECLNCNINLCRKCGDLHIKRTIFASHKIHKLGRECPSHKKKRTLFCTTCSEGLCALCVNKHKAHEDCVKDMNTGIAEKVANTKMKIQSKLKENEKHREKSLRLNKAIESTKRAIKEHLTEKKKELDQRHSALLDVLDQHFGASYQRCINIIEKREKNMLSLNSSLDRVTGVHNLDVLTKAVERVNAEFRDDPTESISTMPKFCPYIGHIEQFGEIMRVPNERQKEDPKFQIFVKTVSGNSFALFTEPYETIEELKSKISNKIGIPFDQIRLVTLLTGKEVQRHELTLADYGIQSENTLILKQNLRKTDATY